LIFLIRHGEPAADWGGHPDPGLSDLGAQQAVAVADRLIGLGAVAVASSPMQRCRQTAAPLAARLGVQPVILPEVSEIVAPPGTPDRSAWLKSVMTGSWPEAGPDFDVWRAALLARVAALAAGTAVFSHFVAINALVGLLENDDRVLIFRPGHASVTILARNPGLAVHARGSETSTTIL
jgi:broad specificity phosphatase PhoE